MKKQMIIIFDFDGTLTIPPLPKYLMVEQFGYPNGTQSEKFLTEMAHFQVQTGLEAIAAYIGLMFDIMGKNNFTPKITDLYAGQQSLKYNKGVRSFFDVIRKLAAENDVSLKNYIVTGGFEEYLKNLPLAKHFEAIYGAQFRVDENQNITGVKKIMLNAMKIDAIKEIIKNNGREENNCENVLYIGDGVTDKDAMEYIHSRGGKTIFVHQRKWNPSTYQRVNKNNAVDFCLEADYRDHADIVKTIKELMAENG